MFMYVLYLTLSSFFQLSLDFTPVIHASVLPSLLFLSPPSYPNLKYSHVSPLHNPPPPPFSPVFKLVQT